MQRVQTHEETWEDYARLERERRFMAWSLRAVLVLSALNSLVLLGVVSWLMQR